MDLETSNSTLDTIYPREATILAAACACIFSIVGVLGKFLCRYKYIFFRFTLFPACSRVGWGRLMLRHYPSFPPNSEAVAFWISELNAALYLNTRVNMKILIISFPRMEVKTTACRVYSDTVLP